MDEIQELAATVIETLTKQTEGLVDDNTSDVLVRLTRSFFSTY